MMEVQNTGKFKDDDTGSLKKAVNGKLIKDIRRAT